MSKLDLTTVRVQTEDLKRIDALRGEFEPKWAVIKRALDKLEK